ncbi:MAG: hypothetical protein AAGM38_14680 [Pseudomonadota bacterium]
MELLLSEQDRRRLEAIRLFYEQVSPKPWAVLASVRYYCIGVAVLSIAFCIIVMHNIDDPTTRYQLYVTYTVSTTLIAIPVSLRAQKVFNAYAEDTLTPTFKLSYEKFKNAGLDYELLTRYSVFYTLTPIGLYSISTAIFLSNKKFSAPFDLHWLVGQVFHSGVFYANLSSLAISSAWRAASKGV